MIARSLRTAALQGESTAVREDVTAVLFPSGLVTVSIDGRLVGSWRRTWWRGRLVTFDRRTPGRTRPAAELVLAAGLPGGWRRSVMDAIEAFKHPSDPHPFQAHGGRQ